MIDFLPNSSEYFKANEAFCKRVSQVLDELKISYNGSCTSYGYDIHFTVQSNGLEFKVNYHRHQSTGTLGTTRTRHYAQIEILNIPSKQRAKVNGISWLSSIVKPVSKKQLNTKYQWSSTKKLDTRNTQALLKSLQKLDIIRLKFRKGKLTASFWNDKILPVEIIDTFKEVLKFVA